MKYDTKTLLDYLSTQTESYLQKAIAEWQTIPQSGFSQQPASGKWSAGQCIAHLNSYGRYYLPQIENAIRTAKSTSSHSKNEFSAGWLGNYFTNMMLTDPSSGVPAKKMPAPKDHSPQNQPDTHQVIAEFIEQQETLLKLIDEAAGIDIGAAKVPISIAKFIRLKLGDTFLFLVAHNYRHLAQAVRALEQAGTKDGCRLAVFNLERMK